MQAAAAELDLLGCLPFAGFCSDPCDGRTQGTLRPTGLRPKFLDKMAYANVTVDPMIFAQDRF